MNVNTQVMTNYGYFLAKYGEVWRNHIEVIQGKFAPKVEQLLLPHQDPVEVPVFFVKSDASIEFLEFLKNDPRLGYDFLVDLTASDETPEEFRFHVIYNLMRTSDKARIRVKVRVKEGEQPRTAIPLWPAANWAEREIWDMFGIRFVGHPNMRRILMDVRFEGHPLRKDYPLRQYQLFQTPEPIDPRLLED